MTDPVHAALWLVIAVVTMLDLCLGGTLVAEGMCRWPAPLPGNRPHGEGPATHSP